jgi:hypothetical protein
VNEILTTADVMAEMKWRDEDAVYRQVRAGRLRPIPGVRPFRFTRRAFLDFLAGASEPSEPPPRKRRGGSANLLPAVPRRVRRRSEEGVIGRIG